MPKYSVGQCKSRCWKKISIALKLIALPERRGEENEPDRDGHPAIPGRGVALRRFNGLILGEVPQRNIYEYPLDD